MDYDNISYGSNVNTQINVLTNDDIVSENCVNVSDNTCKDVTIETISTVPLYNTNSQNGNDCLHSLKIVVHPVGDNDLACNAITTKLTDIVDVAESLDTLIRNIQFSNQEVIQSLQSSAPSSLDQSSDTSLESNNNNNVMNELQSSSQTKFLSFK